MKHQTIVTVEPEQILRTVAGLLHEATRQLHERSATEGSPSPTRLLALDAQLAFGQASAMVGAAPFYDAPNPTEADALVLAHDAEQLLRTVQIETIPVGASSLVIAVCDLVRDLRVAQR